GVRLAAADCRARRLSGPPTVSGTPTMLSSFALSVALATTSVPPGEEVENHAHPGHYAQPTIRTFERRGEDADRKVAWFAYCKELDLLWSDYRTAGSTP